LVSTINICNLFTKKLFKKKKKNLPFFGWERGVWGKVGGWFTLAGMCKHGNACIILATNRRKEDSWKQFVTIYFVGESTSVGTTTTNSFTLATYIPDTRACITFGNGNGSLYATTFVTNNILWVPKLKKRHTKRKRETKRNFFFFFFHVTLSLSMEQTLNLKPYQTLNPLTLTNPKLTKP